MQEPGIDINGAIESMLEEDIQNVGIRYELMIPMSFTEMVTTIIFRGGRGRVFSGIDAYRIKKYVRSSPTAFETWLQSSFHIIHIFQTHAVKAARNNELTFLKIQSAPTEHCFCMGSGIYISHGIYGDITWVVQGGR